MGFSVTENGVLTRYQEEKGIREAVIPDCVTVIGKSAFRDCKKLVSVSIPDTVTEIQNGAFFGCRKLASVTFSDGITTIGENAFQGCKSLTSVILPDTVTEIGEYAFSDCHSLMAVILPDGMKVLRSHVFEGCTGLMFVHLPEYLTEIGWDAFRNCISLTSVTIPDGVTKLWGFEGCTGLTSVTLPEGVTEIGREAFKSCTSLTSVTIPESVTQIGREAFRSCTALTSVIIPETVRKIEEYAFSDTPWLEQQDEDFVIAGNHVLIACKDNSKEIIHIPEDVTYFPFLVVWNRKNLEKVVFRGAVIEKDPKDQVSRNQMLSMIMNRNYSMQMPHPIKYRLLWQVFCVHPDEEELFAYIETHFEKMFHFAIDHHIFEAVEAVCACGRLLTESNIDDFLDYAIGKKQPEIQLMLINYKNEKIGFDKKKAFKL